MSMKKAFMVVLVAVFVMSMPAWAVENTVKTDNVVKVQKSEKKSKPAKKAKKTVKATDNVVK